MTALLQAELIKLRTTRAFAVLCAIAVVSSVLIAGLVSVLTDPTADSVLYDVFASDTSSLFILLLAVVGITGEWRHRTISSSLLATPDRLRFLAAKMTAFAGAGGVLSLLTALSVAIVGTTVLSVRGLPLPDLFDLLAQVGRGALVSALLGALGVGLGALIRSQPIALVGLLLLMFVVDPLLWGLAPDVAPFSPFGGLITAAADLPSEEGVDLLAPGVASVLLGVWVFATFAGGALLLDRRDLE